MTRTADLIGQIQNAHEFRPGPPHQWDGCGVKGTDRCPICGMLWEWGRNGQHQSDYDRFTTTDGADVCLADAVNCR